MKQEPVKEEIGLFPICINDPTIGITIREARLNDAPTIFQAIVDHRDYLKIWLPFIIHINNVADEESFLSISLAAPYNDRNIVCVIEKDQKFCGLIGFTHTDNTNHRTEIGYWLLPEFQGKGIMTRSVVHLCRWAFKNRNMNRIQIRCAVGNDPSNAIPRRLGFTIEGTERDGELLASGQYADIIVYSFLKHEIESWKNNPS